MCKIDFLTAGEDAPPALQRSSDRRIDDRTITVYRLVKVENDRDQGLARCRNISSGGMKLDLSIPLNLNDQVTITMSERALPGKVIWVNGTDCGIAFKDHVDCSKLLNSTAADHARAPRLNANLRARIAYDGGTSKGLVKDISVRGMNVANDGNFHPGMKVRVILDNGCEKEGVVRWSNDNIAGIMLLDPFDVEDLGSMRRLSSMPSGSATTAEPGG